MEDTSSSDATKLLLDWSRGDRSALERLMPLVYDELRTLASRRLRHERSGHTLQGTALVHEAYLRLVDQRRVQWRDRAHFFGVAAQLMRRILVDHARRHGAAKRGRAEVASLEEVEGLGSVASESAGAEASDVDLMMLDEALERLAARHPRQARTVELRFFGGLTIEETAAVLDVSPATVKNDWSFARAWLYREMEGRAEP
jgi:RNA polymerase sigma factor (TIGR02999 family)